MGLKVLLVLRDLQVLKVPLGKQVLPDQQVLKGSKDLLGLPVLQAPKVQQVQQVRRGYKVRQVLLEHRAP
jgi:hypothetical protein